MKSSPIDFGQWGISSVFVGNGYMLKFPPASAMIAERKADFVMIDVCDIQVMKPLLAEHGFHFSKAKGQNFLIARWVPERIAEDSGVGAGVGVR